MKKIENYLDAARNFDSGSTMSSKLRVEVVDKSKSKDSQDRGFTEYGFSDGVVIRHSWKKNVYFGHRDYDHNVEVVKDAGYVFEKKSLFYNMQNSAHL